MSYINGCFVNAHGTKCACNRSPIEVRREENRLLLQIEGSGHGSVTMHGNCGNGIFRTLEGKTFDLTVEFDTSRQRWTISLRRNQNFVAEGEILDMPP